jgi:excisionase family DNA binding protein
MANVMNIEELAEKVKISVSTLRKMVMRKQIPHAKVGSRVVFIEADIDAWLRKRIVQVAL